MKHAMPVLLVIGTLDLGLVASHVACTPGQRESARTVLDVAKTLCIIAHQALPDHEVAQVCGIAEPLFGPMRDVLAGARTASAQAVAGARVAGSCLGADGGAERKSP